MNRLNGVADGQPASVALLAVQEHFRCHPPASRQEKQSQPSTPCGLHIAEAIHEHRGLPIMLLAATCNASASVRQGSQSRTARAPGLLSSCVGDHAGQRHLAPTRSSPTSHTCTYPGPSDLAGAPHSMAVKS